MAGSHSNKLKCKELLNISVQWFSMLKFGSGSQFRHRGLYSRLADKLLAISLKGLDSFMEQLNIKWSIIQ